MNLRILLTFAGFTLGIGTVLNWFGASLAEDGNKAEVAVERDYSAELPRIASLSPSAALKSFEVAPGFKIELVAAEPLVFDPIAFSFDGFGNLFVVEMIDYSEQENDFLGRIAKLTDTNHDGTMDQRSVFVEKLSWPTAIHVWKDGVIVIAPPKMTWYRDIDQDGRHDAVETWCDGFGRSNVQGMANSLRWGVDGYLTGSTSSSGASLSGAIVENAPLELRGRDFRIDPIHKRIEATSGGGQHGAAFNRWGDRFVTSNSDHLQQIIDMDRWLSKHVIGSLPITTRRSIAADGPQAEVFRSSPIEPWRIVRTRLRVSGESPGAIEGGGRAAGYFTGATGTWIVDSEAQFGVPGFDTALVCDVGSNLIHRKKLEPDNLFWKGVRIDDHTEFVRSSDIWFRPVQLGDGPDGALYIADMYREVIEHPKSLPPMIKKHLDLTSGSDRGRIWRVSRIQSEADAAIENKRASESAIAALGNVAMVERLSSSIEWQRRMASQLLIERQALDTHEPLRKLAIDSTNPAARVLAMHLLARFGKLDEEVLLSSLHYDNTQVNRHAIQLASRSNHTASVLSNPELVEKLVKRGDARLLLELAMATDSLPRVRSIQLLQQLIPNVTDVTTRSVIIAVAAQDSWKLFGTFASGEHRDDASRQQIWLASLLPYWCQQLAQNDTKAVAALQTHLQKLVHDDLNNSPERSFVWADAIAKLPSKSAADRFFDCWSADDIARWRAAINLAVHQVELTPQEQKRRSAWFRFSSADDRKQELDRLLVTSQSNDSQLATLEACLWADPKTTASALLDRFSGMTPRLHEPVLIALVSQPEAVVILAEALEDNRIPITQISPTVRQRMSNHPSASIKKRFVKLLTATNTTDVQLQAVIEEYRAVLQSASELEKDSVALQRGQEIFQKNCSACHRIGEVGQDVGPPLKSLHEKSPDQLLISILDPNREVDPRFQSYSILLEDGRVLLGVIREESANQIILAESGGKLTTVARNEIEQLKGLGQSLMPTGMQQQIPPPSLAELIAWLRTSDRATTPP
ncbi:MAG: PVC-type heme-binding CxxCH protein [Pirellulaceae bacterium]|nr:PVC-type heme-binding CxxCH protein [Pirellulaceae bacterium]